jgi:hypothetical protein
VVQRWRRTRCVARGTLFLLLSMTPMVCPKLLTLELDGRLLMFELGVETRGVSIVEPLMVVEEQRTCRELCKIVLK